MIIKANNKPIKILLVEDDEVDIMNVQRAFKKNQIDNELEVVNNGEEAIAYLEETMTDMPKIVLLDINMPKMNGIEFLRHVRADERFKSLYVFVMTTSNEDSDKIEAYKLNVAGYILKPLSFNNFVESVKSLSEYWSIIEFN